MAIEKIEFIADRAGIHPATKQEGGYKLDIAAYGIKVTLTAELLTLLNANKGGGNLVYRFDVYNAGGEYERTATAALGSEPIEYTFTKKDTRLNGMLRIIPIVTSVKNDIAVYEKRLGIITVNVKATPEEETDFLKDSRSLSSLELSAKQAAAAAQAALEDCIEAKEATEAARAALENNETTIIFEGGNAEGDIPVEYVVDNYLSENSQNPVTAAAIFAALSLLESDLRSAINTAVATAVAEATADIADNVRGSIYEVGDIIATMNGNNPEGRFGGTWERIGQGRVLVGVDEEDSDFSEAGKTGGSKSLQEHNHTGTTDNGKYDHIRVVGLAGTNYANNHIAGYTSPGDYSDKFNQSTLHNHTFTTNNTGEGDSGNVQPFVSCYFWKKTA